MERRVVVIRYYSFSLQHEYQDSQALFSKDTTVLTTCNAQNPASFNPEKFQPVELKAEEVIYTYDVKWEKSELTWSHRWDVYLKGNPDDEIHYFSIVNSLMIVLFLTGVVAMIMLRTLHKVFHCPLFRCFFSDLFFFLCYLCLTELL